ncbi:hypothetical protein HCN44_000911 [Aphidius gifuensis]|uniref:Odorant-binding protein n=1 Tax=Aphidius gifuensis TaxID=684658 RepID=A0A835CNQ1_APHGI|nr:uncharacterized protein LOC122856653 [Aphidius gifuensis]KAF7988338.1 hypothetical protein HCN44_000911 [Aphidius gifuensis]
MAILKINFILLIVATVFISKAACLYSQRFLGGLKGSDQLFRIICDKNESDTEFNTLVNNSVTEANICIEESMIAATINHNLIKNQRPDLNLISKVACDVGPLVSNCLYNMTKRFDFCYDQKIKNLIERFYEYDRRSRDLMCNDQRGRLKSVLSRMKCIGKRKDLNSCFKTEKDILETFKNVKPSVNEALNAFSYLSDNCTRLREIETCVSKSISPCQDEVPTMFLLSTEDLSTYSLENTIQEIFSLARNTTRCEINEKKISQIEAVV